MPSVTHLVLLIPRVTCFSALTSSQEFTESYQLFKKYHYMYVEQMNGISPEFSSNMH